MKEAEYAEALARIEHLLDAKAGTPECQERIALVELVMKYEEERSIVLWPIDRQPRPEDFPADAGVTAADIAAFGEGVDRAIRYFRENVGRIIAYGELVQAQRRLAEAGGTAPQMGSVPRRRSDDD